MNIVVHTEISEREVRVRLVQEENEVLLEVVNPDGSRVGGGSILSITTEGKLLLHKGICEQIDLQLDENGRILLADNNYSHLTLG